MSFQITNRLSGNSFTTEDGETILDAALRNGKVFPYSCRSGFCGSCIAELVSGEVDYGEYEQNALTTKEKLSGKLLLCQAVPLTDLVVDAREIAGAGAIKIKTLPCRVMDKHKLAHDVMALTLKLPHNQTLEFIAGQYIDILMRDGRRRSFSLANPPSLPDQPLEIHVRLVPNGRFTGHVFNNMRSKDLLRFEGPFGTFFLRTESERPVILMAGGTGFAPIKSMVEQAKADGVERRMHLFWGVRAERDLYMRELAEQWVSEIPNFEFTPVLSEPEHDSSWNGATGWVHDCVLQQYPDLSDFEVYASGPPPMIDAAVAAFAEHGLIEDRLFFDSFEFANDALSRAG